MNTNGNANKIETLSVDLFDCDADIICHQVNCQGVMGSGVARQVKARYPAAFDSYAELCSRYSNCPPLLLGVCQIVHTRDVFKNKSVKIANLFAQAYFGSNRHTIYTSYDSLRLALIQLKTLALQCIYLGELPEEPVIAIPYLMSCDRGGGDWNGVVYPMISEILQRFHVKICRLPGGERR